MSSTVRVAAVTASLDWGYRRSCSRERFDPAIARAYIDEHVRRTLALMARAADTGAALVLGPEYFRGSELFTTTDKNQHLLTEPVEGETVRRMRALSKRHGVYLAGAFSMAHEGFIAQTGVLTGRAGELVGMHIKHNALPKDRGLEPGQELFDLDIGQTGMLICADVTDDPMAPLLMARRGMRILLVPGCGFAGKFWKEVLITRALDTGCIIIYADECRAAIIGGAGEVLAETHEANMVISAEVACPRDGLSASG